MADWVLSTFRNEDAETILAAAENAAKACVCFIENGPDKAMTQFNTRK
jgi:peptidyl-tRNA hydrolase